MTAGSSWILPEIAESLSVQIIERGETLYRAHSSTQGALWFGPAQGESPRYRYDSHDGSYRVCYLGMSERAAFVEGVLHRAIPRRLVSKKSLTERAIAEIHVVEDLRLARLYGEHLIPTGATAEVAHGEPYATASWPWSRAIFDHADDVDGILYTAKHDDAELAIALFDRAEHKVAAGSSHRLAGNDVRTLLLLDYYRLGLQPFD